MNTSMTAPALPAGEPSIPAIAAGLYTNEIVTVTGRATGLNRHTTAQGWHWAEFWVAADGTAVRATVPLATYLQHTELIDRIHDHDDDLAGPPVTVTVTGRISTSTSAPAPYLIADCLTPGTAEVPAAADSPLELVCELVAGAGMRMLFVAADPHLGGNAVALGPSGCHPAGLVVLGGDLLAVDRDVAAGVLAHETAHHRLGHTALRWPYRATFAGYALVMMGIAAEAISLWAGVGAFALLALVVRLVSADRARARELAADQDAVHLLNETGRDGIAVMMAMVADLRRSEPARIRRGGWVLADHPTCDRRIAGLLDLAAVLPPVTVTRSYGDTIVTVTATRQAVFLTADDTAALLYELVDHRARAPQPGTGHIPAEDLYELLDGSSPRDGWPIGVDRSATHIHLTPVIGDVDQDTDGNTILEFGRYNDPAAPTADRTLGLGLGRDVIVDTTLRLAPADRETLITHLAAALRPCPECGGSGEVHGCTAQGRTCEPDTTACQGVVLCPSC